MSKFNDFKRSFQQNGNKIAVDHTSKDADNSGAKEKEKNMELLDPGDYESLDINKDNKFTENKNFGSNKKLNIESLEKNATSDCVFLIYSDIEEDVEQKANITKVIRLDDFKKNFFEILSSYKINKFLLYGEGTGNFFEMFEHLFSFLCDYIITISYEEFCEIVEFKKSSDDQNENGEDGKSEGIEEQSDPSDLSENKASNEFMKIYDEVIKNE